MDITFTRSGGFAGAATNVEGIVTFKDGGAEVSSPGGKYSRKLSSEEVEQLQRTADSAKPGITGPDSGTGPVRDGYQYDIVITGTDGHSRRITINADSGSETPALPASLVRWVQDEAQKIWSFKVANR